MMTAPLTLHGMLLLFEKGKKRFTIVHQAQTPSRAGNVPIEFKRNIHINLIWMTSTRFYESFLLSDWETQVALYNKRLQRVLFHSPRSDKAPLYNKYWSSVVDEA